MQNTFNVDFSFPLTLKMQQMTTLKSFDIPIWNKVNFQAYACKNVLNFSIYRRFNTRITIIEIFS